MRLRIEQRLAAAYAVAFAAVLISGVCAVETVRELRAQQLALRYSEDLAALVELHTTAEFELLRLASTGSSEHQRAYASALTQMQLKLASLETEAAEALGRRGGTEELRKLTEEEVAFARSLAGGPRERAYQQAIEAVKAAHGRDHISRLRRAVNSMRAGEQARRAYLLLPVGSNMRTTAALLSLATALAGAAVVFAGLWTYQTVGGGLARAFAAASKVRAAQFDTSRGPRPPAMIPEESGFDDLANVLYGVEAELRQSSRILRLVLDTMADGVVVADREGQVVLVNRSAVRILGGKAVCPDVKQWITEYSLRLEDGTPLKNPMELPLYAAAQGHAVRDIALLLRDEKEERDRYVVTATSPITDESELRGAVMVLTDKTERDEAQQALAASEEKFRSFVETTNEWIWSVDERFRLTYSNPAVYPILGYVPKQIAGMDLRELVVPGDHAAFTERLNGIGADRTGAMGVVFRCAHQHGTERWLESNIVPILDANERVIGYRGTARDITNRQIVEEEVRHLNEQLRKRVEQLNAVNKELEAFSYSVSHDLRAPLRSIDGFSQALLEDYEDRLDDTGRDYLRRVRAASQKMAGLIDDLLNLSRVARKDISRMPVDVTELVRSIAAVLEESQGDRRVEFVAHEGMRADADPRLLRIAYENLLNNAWKFTRRRETARIEAGTLKLLDRTTYFVKDNGVGFDMAYVDKLFCAFQRLHTGEEFEGTGIGLATVQRIISRHGGRVWAEGKVGEGATFYFTLG